MTGGATHDDDDDDEEDLQAALALSMCDDVNSQQSNTCDSATQDDGNHFDKKMSLSTSMPNCNNPILSIHGNDDTEVIIKATSLPKKDDDDDDDACSIFDCQSFQKLMWDDRSTTTIDDKQRWICERLQLRCCQSTLENEYPHQHSDHQDATAFDSAAVSANNDNNNNNNNRLIADSENNIAYNDDGSNKSDLRTPLEIFTGFRLSSSEQHPQLLPRHHHHHHLPSQQPIWGLTQTHGGPCGVLAAVQAEMIRILLFGRRVAATTTTEEDGCGGCVDSGYYDDIEVRGSSGGRRRRRLRRQLSNTLYYPFQVSPSPSSTPCTSLPITEREVTDSLAMAIGMILARAALAPCTATTSSCSYDSSSTRIDSPLHTSMKPTVQIVLPRVDCQKYHSPSILEDMGNKSPQRQTSITTTKTSIAWLQELLCTPPIAQSTAHCCSTGSHSTNASSHFLIHTIGVAAATTATTTNDNSRDHGVPLDTSCGITVANDNDDHDSRLPDVKRLRSGSCSKVNIVDQGGNSRLIDNTYYGKLIHSVSPLLSCEQVELTALATAVANFLISGSGHVSSVEMEAKRTNERADYSTTSTGNVSTTTTPLDFFQGAGGVMFLIMSLVATRGIDSLRAGELIFPCHLYSEDA